MNKKTVLVITRLLLFTVFVIAAFNVVGALMAYRKADTVYEELQNRYVEEEAAPEPLPEEEKPPISIDFSALMKENEDIVGWIYCPDTPINYPVVQSNDNNRYLRRDLYGKYLISGTVFTDYRNGSVGMDRNYIIYGHNMDNGTMFGTLVKYKEQSYYEEHPELFYLTPNGAYRIELVAGLVVSKNDGIYQTDPDKAEFDDYIKNAMAESTFDSGKEITDSDVIVTLSTCSYEFNNARYVVIGRVAQKYK